MAATTLALLAAVVVSSPVDTAGALVADGRPAHTESPSSIDRAAADADSGWDIWFRSDGTRVAWTGPNRLPAGGEPLEVRSGDRFLGMARELGRSVVLDLPAAVDPGPESDLELWRSGRRVDVIWAEPLRASPVPPSASFPAPAQPGSAGADPGAPGPHATERLDYELPGLEWPGYEVPLEVAAEVTAPVGLDRARSLVVILHGLHQTCFIGDAQSGWAGYMWPCPPGWSEVPSYRGFRTVADLLASRGSVVVSVSANSINFHDVFLGGVEGYEAGMAARSALLRHHLGLWADWVDAGGDPWGGRFQGAIEMSNVVLVGHSRGGEGVVLAAIDSSPDDPWQVRGIAPIAPTAFGRLIAPRVHTAVLLPDCDGDVISLAGQSYVDGGRDLLTGGDRAIRSAVLVEGANHSWFNSEWTPGSAVSPSAGDDVLLGLIDNPECLPESPSRLAPEAQRAVAATYVSALVEVAVAHSRPMLDLLDGPAPPPPSVLGAQVRTTSIGGDRTALYEPGLLGEFSVTGALSATACTPSLPPLVPLPSCTPPESAGLAPHWTEPRFAPSYEQARALRVDWEDGGGAVRLDLEGRANARSFDRLDLRFVIDQFDGPLAFDVRLLDADGRIVEVPASGIEPLPGGQFRRLWAQAASVDLRGLRGINAAQIVAVDIVTPTQAGSGFLLDAMLVRERLPGPNGPPVPVLGQMPEVVVAEGDGPNSAVVSVPITGTVREPAEVWIEVNDPFFLAPGDARFYQVEPGDDRVDITVSWLGDDTYGTPGFPWLRLSVVPHRNIVTSDTLGTVVIEDDDPPPEVTISPLDASGTEATGLSWSVALDEPSSNVVFVAFWPLPPPSGVELSVGDLDPWTQFDWCADMAPPELPLSEAFLCPGVVLLPGETTATLHLGTIADGVVEGPEVVALEAFADWGPLGVITGTVDDA